MMAKQNKSLKSSGFLHVSIVEILNYEKLKMSGTYLSQFQLVKIFLKTIIFDNKLGLYNW